MEIFKRENANSGSLCWWNLRCLSSFSFLLFCIISEKIKLVLFYKTQSRATSVNEFYNVKISFISLKACTGSWTHPTPLLSPTRDCVLRKSPPSLHPWLLSDGGGSSPGDGCWKGFLFSLQARGSMIPMTGSQ